MFNFNKKKPISEIPYFYSQNLIDEQYYKKLSNNFPTDDLAVSERLDFQNSRIRIRNKNLENYLSKISDEALYAYNVYQIEGEGRNLFSHITGDENSIMGLPVSKIKEYLKNHQ